MKVSILSIYAAAVFFTVESNAKSEKLDKDEKSKEKSMAKLPPCSACSVLVKSFEKGLERTSRGAFTNYVNKILDFFTPPSPLVNGHEHFDDTP